MYILLYLQEGSPPKKPVVIIEAPFFEAGLGFEEQRPGREKREEPDHGQGLPGVAKGGRGWGEGSPGP